jgi:hypothetical protein
LSGTTLLRVNLRKIFLIVLLASLAAAAAMGVWGIVFSRYADERLIGTMLSVGLFSLTLLGSAIVLDKRRWVIAMLCSFGVSGIGLLLFLTEIWFRRELGYSETPARLMGESAVVAVALPLAGLLALTAFQQPALRMVRLAGIALAFICAATISIPIWADRYVGEEYFKFLAVVAIATALAVVCLPILHKLAGLPPPSETVSSDVTLAITCPRCALSQTVPAGPSRCGRCRLKFVIEIEEPRCPKCGYLLFQLTEPRCPECGHALDEDDVMMGGPVPARQTPVA